MIIAVLPDAAMIIVHLVTKNGHEYLSSTNISEETLRDKDPYDERDFDENLPPFTMTSDDKLTGNKYTTNEAPSGVRGRLSLFDKIITESEAAIIMGQPPRRYKHMYNHLNELILFGCISCGNLQKIVISELKKKNIPILIVPYPTSREEIISMIQRINEFLENLENRNGIYNEDNLNIDLKRNVNKVPPKELKQIIKEVNKN